MYKLTTKDGSIFFQTIDDLFCYLSKKKNDILGKDMFVKISFEEI